MKRTSSIIGIGLATAIAASTLVATTGSAQAGSRTTPTGISGKYKVTPIKGPALRIRIR